MIIDDRISIISSFIKMDRENGILPNFFSLKKKDSFPIYSLDRYLAEYFSSLFNFKITLIYLTEGQIVCIATISEIVLFCINELYHQYT